MRPALIFKNSYSFAGNALSRNALLAFCVEIAAAVNRKASKTAIPMGTAGTAVLFFANADHIRGVGERHNPVAVCMPFIQPVVLAGIIHIGQRFIIHGDRSQLIVGGRQKLNQIVPILFVFILQVCRSRFLQKGDVRLKFFQRRFCHMVSAEIGEFEHFGMNFMHGAGGIGNSSHLVRVKFFPPIQWRGDVGRDQNLANEFSVIAPRPAELPCQSTVVFRLK